MLNTLPVAFLNARPRLGCRVFFSLRIVRQFTFTPECIHIPFTRLHHVDRRPGNTRTLVFLAKRIRNIYQFRVHNVSTAENLTVKLYNTRMYAFSLLFNRSHCPLFHRVEVVLKWKRWRVARIVLCSFRNY